MKKIFIFLVLSSFIIGVVSAQDAFAPNKRLKSGVWLKMGYDAAFTNFMSKAAVNHTTSITDYGINAQLGTTFYIGPRIANMLRFGLDIGWIDFSYYKLKSTYFDNGSNYFISFFELGPKISFSPVKYIAFDLYGRISPSLSLLYYLQNDMGSSTDVAYTGYRTNGLIGASFRIGVLSIGPERGTAPIFSSTGVESYFEANLLR